jgi:hypothetical protein
MTAYIEHLLALVRGMIDPFDPLGRSDSDLQWLSGLIGPRYASGDSIESPVEVLASTAFVGTRLPAAWSSDTAGLLTSYRVDWCALSRQLRYLGSSNSRIGRRRHVRIPRVVSEP